MSPTQAYLALNLVPKVGPVRARRLVAALGSPEAVLRARKAELTAVQGIGPEIAESLLRWEDHVDLAAEERKIADRGITILTPADGNYPPLLKEIHDPPLALYVWGTLRPEDRHAIGIVGSRRATHYGITCARKFGYQLASCGLAVVSGLARGIDTAAHEGALAAKGRTLAIIGSGIGKLYPPENQALAERIAENGAVISEFPVDYPPDKQSFPLRNRIISGWSSGILVVEAPGRSGSLITANQAAEQGRSVYAIPGPIDRPGSEGPNRLIQDGARLVISAQDILDDLGSLFSRRELPGLGQGEATAPVATPNLSAEESAALKAIGDDESLLDDIAERSGLPVHVASTALLKLEMRRLVKQLPGKYFVRLR
ncbi:MAG: DNA-processing protein DprA [Verrucomicrobiales bacterium]